MPYHIIAPPKHLAEYVRCFWVLESDTPYQHHAVADGLAEMVFHYRGTFQEIKHGREESSWTSGVQAQSQHARQFITHTGFGIFGVYLYPFALSAIFSAPADVFSNEMPDLQNLLGREGEDLEEKIMLAANHGERVQILSAFIETKIARHYTPLNSITQAVRHVIDHEGQVSIRNTADAFGLSLRQFERRFKKSAGFSPKLYSRIIRFSAAIKAYQGQDTSLTAVAHTCGYYDQSHFIEDFRMFSGVSPGLYFKHRDVAFPQFS